MTAVAATNVGDIVEDGQEDDNKNTKLESLKTSDPFGHFNFGSTIVLLFETPKEDINNFSLNINDKLKVGEAVYM